MNEETLKEKMLLKMALPMVKETLPGGTNKTEAAFDTIDMSLKNISLRDLFAAFSLSGFRAAKSVSDDGKNLRGHDEIAKWCYNDADALLKKRKEK